jgi:hypothetical protein
MLAAAAPSSLSRALQLISGVRRSVGGLVGDRRAAVYRGLRWMGGIMVVAAFAIWCALRVFHDQHYRYRRLRLGITVQELDSVMGRSADCRTRVGATTVLYFLDRALRDGHACSDLAPEYKAPINLPWVYSSIQVALNRQGAVSAFVHIGEATGQSLSGDKPEGTLAQLPLRAFD